jgi:hypothetical protein
MYIGKRHPNAILYGNLVQNLLVFSPCFAHPSSFLKFMAYMRTALEGTRGHVYPKGNGGSQSIKVSLDLISFRYLTHKLFRARSATVVSNRKFLKIEIFGCKNQSCGLQPSVLLGTSLDRDLRDTPSRNFFFHTSQTLDSSCMDCMCFGFKG